jgi:acyl-CoA thioesterase I
MFPPHEGQDLEYLIQFRHPEKTLVIFPGLKTLTLADHARLFQLEVGAYEQILEGFATRARQAAAKLLEDASFATAVDDLPLEPGQLVLGLGDSITAERQSWFEILRHVLELRRPQDRLRLVNAGVSAETTLHVLSRFAGLCVLGPHWILTLIGTNDVRLHGRHPTKTLLTPDETGRNLEQLRALMLDQTQARRLWLTPPPLLEARIETHWFPVSLQQRWKNADLERVVQCINQLGDPVIDTRAAFNGPLEPLLLEDGLHPSLAGQSRMARMVVEHWNPALRG